MAANSVGKLTAQMIVESEQAEGSLKKISALAKLAKTDLGSIGGLFLANGDFKKFGDGIDDSTSKMRNHTAAVGDGEKALRGFYREQRLQDRTIRESKDALLGLTFGIMAVTSGMGEGSAKAKQFQTSLIGGIAAMQAGEFAAFGLGTAGKNLGGTLGNLAGKLSQNAGMIGTIIGLGTGLYMFFRNAEDYAKSAADNGLKKFSDELDTIAGKMDVLLPSAAKARKLVYASELQIVTDELNTITDEEKRLNDKKNEFARKAAEESKSLNPGSGQAAAFSIFWNDRANREEMARTDEEMKKTAEKKAQLIARQKELTALAHGLVIGADKPALTPDDLKKDKLGKSTATSDRGEYLDGLKGLTDYGKLLYETGKITTEQYVEQLNVALKSAGESKVGLEIEKEIARVKKEQNDIAHRSAEEEKRALDDKADQIQMQYQLNKISAEKAIEELETLRSSTSDTNQRLKFEQKIVDVKNNQIELGNQQLDQAVRIGSILEQAFSKSGDDLIAKLYQALQIAVQIAKLMQTKANGDGASALDWVETAASVIGFLANTGTDPSGSGSSQAAQLNLSMGSASDNIMPNGLPYNPIRTSFPVKIPKGYLEQSVSSTSSTAGLMQEIRALRTELAEKDFSVHLHDVITMSKALEKFMPEYERYKKNKVVE